jgi:hypothetical protein
MTAHARTEARVRPRLKPHIPHNVKAVKVNTWRTYAYLKGISGSDEERAKQQAFKRASEVLVLISIVHLPAVPSSTMICRFGEALR